jgi:hypothetical protein
MAIAPTRIDGSRRHKRLDGVCSHALHLLQLGPVCPIPVASTPSLGHGASLETKAEQHMRTLIVGGGAIGTSIAYHLAARGADVIVIERKAIACAASGKSGGFLAMEWCDGSPLIGPLTKLLTHVVA